MIDEIKPVREIIREMISEMNLAYDDLRNNFAN